MSDLDRRIDILHQSGVISNHAADKIQLLRRLFLQMYGIELTEENASACVTHFCMALARLECGEDITPLDPLVRDDIEGEDDYEAACLIADTIFRFVSPLTPNERDYILMHIIMLLSNVRKEYDAKALNGGG